MVEKNWEKDYPLIRELPLDENSAWGKMLRFIGEGKKVVDFGCATGYFAKELNKHGCIVTGVDINDNALEIAQEFCKDVIIADLDFVSVTEVLPEQEFDVAVFGDVLEHLRNPWKVLEEVRKILKPNGFVVASIPNIAHGAIRLALLQGKFDYAELGILDNTHLRFFTKKSVEELFERSGYLVNSVDSTKLPMWQDSLVIPKINKDEFSDEVIKKIEEDEYANILQFVIQAYPCTIEKKYAVLNDKYNLLSEESEQLQAQVRKIRGELEQAQSQFQQTQAELTQYQSQLQQTQAELAQSQSQFQQTQAELTQSQSQLQQTQAELAQSQSQIHQTQAELTQSQSQLHQTQAELTQSHSQLKQTQVQLERSKSQLQQTLTEFKELLLQFQQVKVLQQRSQGEVTAMQTSKFWKLRTQWFKVKKFLNLVDETEVENNLTYTQEPQGLFSIFSDFSNEDWFKAVLQSISTPIIKGVEFPGFPSDEMQISSVGSTAERNLHEAFNFYTIIKNYLSSCGQTLSSDSHVLDFGCGWGRIIRFFLKDVPVDNVHGVDVDEEMINLCRETVRYGKYHVVNSSPPSDLPSESFDLIYAYSVFSHLNEETHLKWIEEFSRILKPNGLLVVTTRSKSHLDLCRSLREQGHHEDSHAQALADSFTDYDAASHAYDNGQFLHQPTGAGASRPASFYGETLIPRGYVEREWTRFLMFRDFMYDPTAIPQAVIVMQKSA